MDKSGIFLWHFCGWSLFPSLSEQWIFLTSNLVPGCPTARDASVGCRTNKLDEGRIFTIADQTLDFLGKLLQTMCSSPQLYCQKFIWAQEWENIVFRFVIGKAKQGSDVFGGFSPIPMCLFIFTGSEWSSMSADPPLPTVLLLPRASPQCWQQQGKFWESRAAPCAWGLVWPRPPLWAH